MSKKIEIQGEHHRLCFPAIRDIRTGDWGPTCFTCETLWVCENMERNRTLDELEQELELDEAPYYIKLYEIRNAIEVLRG